MDKLIIVDSNDNVITKWICVNLDQLFVDNNQPATAVNQVGYTIMTRHITSLGNYVGSSVGVGLGMAINTGVGSGAGVTFGSDNGADSVSGNDIGSNGGNGLGSNNDNDVSFGIDNNMGSDNSNGLRSYGGNSIGFGIEVDVDGDPKEGLVCLGTQLAGTATGLASSKVYIAVLTSLITGRSHPTPTSSISWAMKLLYLLLRTKTVSILIAVRPLENIQDTIVYNKFLEAVSNNKE